MPHDFRLVRWRLVVKQEVVKEYREKRARQAASRRSQYVTN